MKAALWYKRNDVRIEETPEPQVSSGKVKVKVKWAGICGSDIHEYIAGPLMVPVDQPHPITGAKAPVVLGHEFSGEVIEVGEGVTRLKVGDRVAVEPLIPCGQCPACQTKTYNLCYALGGIGLSAGNNGGFGEYAVVDADFAHKIPDNITYEEAALVEPLSVALHSVRRANFMTGQTALVLGCGPIGLSTIACLRAAGAKLIIVLQRKSPRQELAQVIGADYVFDCDDVNIPEEVRKLTEGYGADVAFETTGSQTGFDIGLDSIKTQGTLIITSLWEEPVRFNPNSVLFTEKSISGTIAYRGEFPMVLSLIASGKIKLDRFITKKIHLDDLLEEGFGTMLGPDKKNHVKILVTPDKSLL